MRDRKKRNIIIGALCSLLVFMGIGYAVLSQTLNISGIANMKGTWDIKITDISEASRTGKADPGTPTISSSGVSASFEANLWMPGDSITYNITVKNNGNIDAALKELVPSVENGVQQVKFSNNAVQGKVLRQKESYTFQVSVVFDEDATEIPKDSKTNPPKYTISLTFVQYTGNSLYTPTNETTDNSCFVINTAGEITGYDYNCGTVVTVPAEIDGIQVKSIAKNAFSDADSFNMWVYSKEESATLTKTYFIFKDQNARSLFLEINGMTQEELDAMAESDNTYNYLKGDSALNGVDLGTLDGKYFIYRSANGKIAIDEAGNIPITELDLSHAEYLESIDLNGAPNLKRLNLNTANALTFKSVASNGYGPATYALGESTIGELEELIINTDIFNNSKKIQGSYNTTTAIFRNTHIKKLIILDGKASHKLDISTNDSGLFYYDEDIEKIAGVENVIIDDGITELGTKSLYSLNIKSITLPNTITTIGEEALRYNKLMSLTIPASVEKIGIEAFHENQLTSLTIPASVETIGRYAFSGNPITAINFEPNSKLKIIDDGAFNYNNLTNVTIPASVETIGGSAFDSNKLTAINFEPNSKLKTIGVGAFDGNNLTSLTIPASVETIGGSAFSENQLTNLTIPASVETIDQHAFEKNQITTINFEPNSKLKTIGWLAFGNNKLTSLTIPSSVETIGDNAFQYNQLTTINFEPNSKLKTIGKFVFEGNKLTNTGLSKLPSSLTSLATSAFYRNPNLTQITLTSPKDLEGWPNGGRVDGRTVTYER